VSYIVGLSDLPESLDKIDLILDKIVLGDCLELMKRMPGGCVDAVITDPPYGIGEARANNPSRSCLARSKDYGIASWDDRPCQPESVDEMRRVSIKQVIFGGNFFALPPSPCWLIWDKQNGLNDFADCELAWTNLDKAVRRIYWQWHGMIRKGGEERYHPTQKPEGVMTWCIQQAGNPGVIFDPFLGSGTTAVAAKKLGRHFIGCEISEEYCKIAEKRLLAIDAQPSLFKNPSKPEQLKIQEKK